MDITACSGQDEANNFVCPFKDNCYRFTCTSESIRHPHRQSYFVEIPFDKEKADCQYYWANSKVEI